VGASKLVPLIDKYLNKSKKVYACFIDLHKAFDSVIHSALFLKLLRAKIRGKFLALLKSLYSNISLRVIVDPNFYNIPKFYLNSSVDPLDFQIIELNHRHRGDNLYASVLIIQVNMNDQNHQTLK
jgi:hypothetical protein